MIYLVTGTLGAGKTSNTLWDFLFNPAHKDRPKFATFIAGFDYEKHGVTPLENIEGWRELPTGALVLIDEADKFIPAKARGDIPEWIRELARSRHYGIDFYFITQLHSMIHHHVRGLIEAHIHYHRAFGMKTTSQLRWETLQTNVNSPTARNIAQKKRVKVNPRIFELYKSTELDTQRPQLPWKWIVTAGIAIVVMVAALFYVRAFFNKGKAEEEVKPGVTSPAAVAQPLPPGRHLINLPAQQGLSIIAQHTPRVMIDPSTAPIYDELTKPSDFPRVAACMSTATSCNCFTQQATPVYVPLDTCRQMVKQGWFDRWKTARAQSEAVLAGKPDEASARAALQQPAKPEPIVIGTDPPAPRIADGGYKSIYEKY